MADHAMLEPMKRETVLALNELNQVFYARIARQWSETRRYAWPGFTRVLEVAPPTAAGAFRVLDAGAGDGRFAAFLHERLSPPPAGLAYLGIDASAALLSTARTRQLGAAYRFDTADFIRDEAGLPEGPFELIVLFGVLHHVPSFALRRGLVERLARRTAAGGHLALTFWRLDRDARFAKRVRSIARYNRVAARPIEESDLEPGDTLLAWGEDEAAVRYCHFADASETEALIDAAGLPTIARFEADGRGGRLNEYVVFSRR